MMKKILLIFCLIFLQASFTNAEEIVLQRQTLLAENPQENPIKLESSVMQNTSGSTVDPEFNNHFSFYDKISKTFDNIYNLQVENTNVPNYLLEEPLTHKFERGPLESIHTWGVLQMNNAVNIPDGAGVTDKFNVPLINVLIDGTFRGGQDRFRIMFNPTPSNRGFWHTFIRDVYFETDRIPNHSVLIGNSRPAVGYEGAQSSYTLPFILRSQISRNFGTARKLGVRIKGNYSYVDYDLGGYSSDTYWTEFFPGLEFDGWVNFKPLAKTDGKYGNLVIGGGIVGGQRNSTNFFVGSGYVGYDYKKFWTKMEYAAANGSNGASGLTDKHQQGWHITAGYRITPKLEILARYDEFDPDKSVRGNNQREYTAGVNYYLKGQALRLILNYVYCQNEAAKDSHRIVVGTQIIL